VSSPTGRARFEAEARMGACVVHPNVVAVYDIGVERDMPFVVMECTSGTTLADEIACGPLRVERTLTVIRQVLDGIAAAHDRGVLHRNVKPTNVLAVDDGRVKVGDFGIAWPDDHGPSTDAYLAPERIEGGPASVRSDLYSVGVMAYEALTGLRHGPFRPLRSLRDDVPAAVAHVVTRAMARLPEDRYASVEEFAAALDEASTCGPLDDDTRPVEPVLRAEATRVLPAVPPVPPASAAVWRRLRAPLFAGIAGVALVGSGFAAATHAAGSAKPGTKPDATANTLPGVLRAPFDELEQAVGK
jgi:serine/threonine protein kinase